MTILQQLETDHFACFAVINNLGVTLVIAIGFKLRFESNCFQYIWSQSTNYQLESRVEKDAERFSDLCQCKRLARVLIISRTLLKGSLFPVESQLQSSFCLSNISRPLVVLQISTGGLIESFQSFI